MRQRGKGLENSSTVIFCSEVRSAENVYENGILKMENEYDTKTFGEKLFYGSRKYVCVPHLGGSEEDSG